MAIKFEKDCGGRKIPPLLPKKKETKDTKQTAKKTKK